MTEQADPMPTVETVRQWMRDNPEFAARMRRARLLGCEKLLIEPWGLADDALAAPSDREATDEFLLQVRKRALDLLAFVDDAIEDGLAMEASRQQRRADAGGRKDLN